MAEPQQKSSDILDFEAYPSSLPPGLADLRFPNGATSALTSLAAEEEDFLRSRAEANGELGSRAERVGEAVGKTLGRLTLVPSRARHGAAETLHSVAEKANEIRQTAQQRFEDFTSDAKETLGDAAWHAKLRISDFAGATQEKVRQLSEETKSRAREVGYRSKRYAKENPVHVLLAVAAVGLAVGLAIRLTSKRASRA